MLLNGKKMNFLGDSITEGVGVQSKEEIYLNVLAGRLGLACARNYGISGTRIARQTGDDIWGAAYVDRYMDMDDDADVVVVFGGTNDYGHGNAPFGEKTDRTGATYCGACHALLAGLIAKYPRAELVVMTPLHRRDENAPSMYNGRPLKDYVDALCEAARAHSVPVLDLYANSGIYPDDEGNREAFCPDGLHPNAAGHLRIASRLEGFLRAL